MTESNEPRKPTEKEAFFFLTILNSMKAVPNVDWDLVARRAGYSNAVCARTRYGQIKKQIGYKEDGSLDTPSPVKSRAKKGIGSGTNGNASKVTKKSTAKSGRGKTVKPAQTEEPEEENIKQDSPTPSVEYDEEVEGDRYSATQNSRGQEEEESGDYGSHDDAQGYEDGLGYYDTTEDLEI